MGEEMRAVTFNRYGPPEVLQLGRMPIPAIGPDEVLVRVKAASINPADCKLRSGAFRFFSGSRFPMTPGLDVAGEVARVGEKVTAFKPGDAVYGFINVRKGGGAYAEYACISARGLASKPEKLSFVEAGAVGVGALTALQGMRDKGGLKAGGEVLIIGASGGVGTFAVQIAKVLDARVTGVCSSRNVELVRELGADRIIDYTKEDFAKDAARYDVILDTVDGDYARSLPLLKPGGAFVTIVASPKVFVRSVLSALPGMKKVSTFLAEPNGDDLRLLAGWLETGKVKPVIDRVFPLEQAAEAHQASESGRARGKLVLEVR